MSAPTCKHCGGTGAGVEFPVFPLTPGESFGTICVPCDEGKPEEEPGTPCAECGVICDAADAVADDSGLAWCGSVYGNGCADRVIMS